VSDRAPTIIERGDMSSTPARVLTALALAATVAVGAWTASAAAETSSGETFGPGPFCCIG
jgi:hypothetical protein